MGFWVAAHPCIWIESPLRRVTFCFSIGVENTIHGNIPRDLQLSVTTNYILKQVVDLHMKKRPFQANSSCIYMNTRWLIMSYARTKMIREFPRADCLMLLNEFDDNNWMATVEAVRATTKAKVTSCWNVYLNEGPCRDNHHTHSNIAWRIETK